MNDEAPNSTSESEASNESQEEKKARPARKSTKKVVRGVRDAKTRSARDAEGESDAEGGSADEQGKGGNSSDEAPQEIPMVVEEAPREGRSNSGREERRRPARGRRAAKSAPSSRSAGPVDSEELSRRAWKIYQADVAEEGITLIDNTTGRQLALRSFELARVFLEEQARQVKLNQPSNEKESNRGRSPRAADRKSAEQRSEEPRDEEQRGDEDGES